MVGEPDGVIEPGTSRALPLAGKRIIFIFASLELGGAERQALLLARHLVAQQQAQVEVWGVEGGPGRVSELCDEAGLPWRLVPTPWGVPVKARLRGILNFARELRRARPDVVLPYTMYPNVLCGLVWRCSGARLCVWNQRDEGMGRLISRMGRLCERRALRQTPLFISNSRQGAKFLQDACRVPESRIRIIHNGVQLAPPVKDREAWRAELGVDECCLLACMVANIHNNKDHPTLLYAWHLVGDRQREQGRDAILLLAGRLDVASAEVQALAVDLELGQNVRFLGSVKDITGLLQSVDLGVFSSRSEGVPNGVLECMAAGLAVAATDIPGIREAVGDVGVPYLAPPGDAVTLAEHILTLADDPQLRARLGAANRERIETEYNLQRMCEHSVAMICEGMKRHR